MDSREGQPGTAALKVQEKIEGAPNYVRKIFSSQNFKVAIPTPYALKRKGLAKRIRASKK
jgi:hypothetical protein